MRRIFFALFSFFFWVVSWSQPTDITFTRITTANSLSQSWVKCIYQDSTGFVWFGTTDGLNRFDGKNMKVYLPDYMDSTSLGEQDIGAILKKSKNELWIGTQRGVYIYNTVKDNFRSFHYIKESYVNAMDKDMNGNIWFGCINGLFKYSIATNHIDSFFYSQDGVSIPSNYIRQIKVDSRNNVWIATTKGLALYKPGTNNFTVFQSSANRHSLSGPDVWDLVEMEEGTILLGIANTGIDVYRFPLENPDNGVFQQVTDFGSPITLIIDNQNVLWMGNGSNKGLDLMDLNKENALTNPKIYHYENVSGLSTSLSDNSIHSFCIDNNNGMWIGTYAGGANYYNPSARKFHNFEMSQSDKKTLSSNLVNAIYIDENDIWIGTESGLDRIDRKTKKISHFYHEPNNESTLGGNSIYAIYKDSRGNLWVGAWNGGVSLFNYKTKTFKRFLKSRDERSSFINYNVFSICEDSYNNLWIGTIRGGLFRYEYNTGIFQNYNVEPGNPASLYHDAVNKIFETSDSTLYISTYNSLEEFDRETNSFIHHIYNERESNSVSKGNILDIFEDSNHNLWVGSNSGLNLMNRKNNTFTLISTPDDLPNSTVLAIQEDNNKNIWLSTNRGLVKFEKGVSEPLERKFIAYTKDDGLPTNEFSRRAVFKDENGTLYFGTSHGYTWFHPDSLKTNTLPPKVILTDFSLFQPGLVLDNNKLELKKNINELDHIQLSYDQCDFVIKYASLSFLHPLKNQYKYRLVGYDKEDGWRYVGNKQEATYTNISPGTYIFQVFGSNNDGIWSSEPKSIKIIITPPWWQTIVFRIFLVCFIFLVIYLVFRIRFTLLNKQKRLLSQKVNERTSDLSKLNLVLEEKQKEIISQNKELLKHREDLEKLVDQRTETLKEALKKAEEADILKSSFLANMSHEIRTPLNAIVGFSSLVCDQETEESDKATYIEIINSSSDSLLVLINDILDISLIESNQMTLTKTVFNVDKLMLELEEYYHLKNDKNFEIKFEKPPATSSLNINSDPVRFRQVISNLVNNAFKFTNEGEITFGYIVSDNSVEFYVKDTGIGISRANINKIFEAFYKIGEDQNVLYRGTGIGLSISKMIVKLMGGDLKVESVINQGSRFYFVIPINIIAAYEEAEIRTKVNTIENFEKINFLIAEDDEVNYLLIEKVLKKTGAKIYWAKNGKEAVGFVKNHKDIQDFIVLMDIKMPVMDGYKANREIRKINNTIPVIAVTACAQSTDKSKIISEKFAGYISKPIDTEKLIDTIKKYVN